MKQSNKIEKFISWMFLSTGVFAIVGALYTWGEGPLYLEDDLLTALVPWADLLFTGPLSILAAYGIFIRKDWGHVVGLMVCGIYLFGSPSSPHSLSLISSMTAETLSVKSASTLRMAWVIKRF